MAFLSLRKFHVSPSNRPDQNVLAGGRILVGDVIEGFTSRTERPLGCGVTKEKHDFTWNKKGVRYYCATRCMAMAHAY